MVWVDIVFSTASIDQLFQLRCASFFNIHVVLSTCFRDYCKLENGLKSFSPLWDFGTNCRQPFSRVQSSNGIHNPKALGGSVYRKVESLWGVTVKKKYKRKRITWLASCEKSSSSLVLPPSCHTVGNSSWNAISWSMFKSNQSK